MSVDVGKYGLMRLRYIKEYRKPLYNELLKDGELEKHLLSIDQAARDRLDLLMPQFAQAAGATEALKAKDPLKWVGLMNTCKAQVEEIIMEDLIYC